jgi:hypothetical protein
MLVLQFVDPDPEQEQEWGPAFVQEGEKSVLGTYSSPMD